MKKLFNHTKRPTEDWEGYNEEEWGEAEGEYTEDDEYYAEEDSYTEDGEYYAEGSDYSEGGEYYAEGSDYNEGGEYYVEGSDYNEGGEYYVEGSDYNEGGEYYVEGGDYTEGGEYYVEGGDYIEDGDANEDDKNSEFDGEITYNEVDNYRVKRSSIKEIEDGDEMKGFFAGFRNKSAIDIIIGMTGVAVLVLTLVVGLILIGTRNTQKQVSGFVAVGKQLDNIALIGESGLLAVADAQLARLEAANQVFDSENKRPSYDEDEYDREVTVTLAMTSIQKDLKIKFTNQRTDKLVPNVPFVVNIKEPDGNKTTWSDDDMDGIIYKKDITPGTYEVSMEKLTDESYSRYIISDVTKSVVVKKDISYQKVDVDNEVKTEDEVDARKEDTAKNEVEVESSLTDTIPWVESKITAATYNEISKSTIIDPMTTLSAKLTKKFMRMALSVTSAPGEAVTIKVGEGTALSVNAQVDPAGTEGEREATISSSNISWQSSDSGVASVDGSGNVTGVAVGSATVSYSGTVTVSYKVDVTPSEEGGATEESKSTDVSVSGSYSVTVEEAPASAPAPTISLSPNSIAALEAGKSESVSVSANNFTATPDYAASSDNPEVATATVENSQITVTGVAEGTTTIHVTATQGTESASADITVTVIPAAKIPVVTLDKSAVELTVNAEAAVTATGKDFAGTVTYSYSVAPADAGIVTVTQADNVFTVKGVKAGDVTVTVAATDGTTTKEAAFTVKVTEPLKKGTVEVAPTAVAMVKEKTVDFQVKAKDFTADKKLVYSAKVVDEKTATVKAADENGKFTVTGVAKGETDIVVTVNYENGTEATAAVATLKVTVGDKKSMEIDKTSLLQFTNIPTQLKVTIKGAAKPEIKATSSDSEVADVSVGTQETDSNKNITAPVTLTLKKAGQTTITVSCTENGETVSVQCVVTVRTNPKEDKYTELKDTSGNGLYVFENGTYRKAVYADYFTFDKFFLRGEAKYTGWQTLSDGKVYFFKADGTKATGEQVIQGAKYTFASDGSLVTGSGTMGIDVSKWQGTIDWNKVKNSGVNYVIIRCGYRGSSQGSLIEDPKFTTNIKGAIAAGLKVGVYFVTQAVDEREAVEEASMVISQIKNYKISYPVFLDVESSGGRGDKIDKETRTAVCKAFCETIKNAGYTPGIYANKNWFETKMNASELNAYKIWLAQYSAAPTYKGKIDLWQYRSTGKVSGISGNVDMNTSYLGY